MKKTIFTPDELKAYFAEDYKSHFYDTACKEAHQIKVHSDGLYPEKLIEERRPNEHPEVQAYRKQIYVPKTKGYFGKVFTSLNKIRRSQDWAVKYAEEEFSRIPEGETLEDYCEYGMPLYKKLEHWTFKVLLRQYLIDPNSVVLWMPKDTAPPENELLEPMPFIFCSDYVVEYADADWCILKDPNGEEYTTNSGDTQTGDAYFLVTTLGIYRYAQTSAKREFTLIWTYLHTLAILPAFKIGSTVFDVYEMDILYKSKIDGMIPHFDEAVREYSDIQAAIVLHIFPERWEYAQADCQTCSGSGRIASAGGHAVCPDCHGIGYKPSPYQKVLITKTEAGENAPPTPPVGYVVKDTEIVKLQDTRIENHIYEGLGAVSMEFLMDTPMSQSGTAKEVDRDELNTFVSTVAEDIIDVMERSYWLISKFRYGGLYSDDELVPMQPQIPIPQKFDLLGVNYLEKELQTLKTANANPYIVGQMEVQYAAKKFPDMPEMSQWMEMVMELDPFFGLTESDKGTRRNNKAITDEDYVISSNIQTFLMRATSEDANFMGLDYMQQYEVLKGYAAEIVAAGEEKIKAEQEQQREMLTSRMQF